MVTNESNKSINCSFPRSSSSLITLQNLTPEMFSLRRSSSMMSLFKSGGSSPKGKETIVVEKNSKQFREDSSTSNVSKLHRRTKNLKVSELDFGCAGELAELMEEPFIQEESNHYHHAHSSISSINTSGGLPSLTHSRNQSSCSDLSSFTQDTSPPTSPSSYDTFPSSPSSSKRSSHGSPGFHHQKRQSEEILAIDALNDYLTRVRLSVLVEEDFNARPSSTRTCTSSPHSVNNLLLPSAIISSRPLSYNNRPLSSSSSLLNNRPFSTSALSNHTIIARSPSPIAESSCHEDELDELYQFFSNSRCQSRCESRASDRGIISTVASTYAPPLPPKSSSAPASIYSRYTSRSSKGIPRSSFPQLLSKDINKLKDDRNVPYGWI